MNQPARHAALTCGSLIALLALAACHRHDDASTAPAKAANVPAPAASARPAATSSTTHVAAPVPFHIASITLGSTVDDATHAITTVQSRFVPGNHAIYVSVATEGHTDGSAIGASWSYVESKDAPFNRTSETIATDGPARTTFKVLNPNPWPLGHYKVVISVDGKDVAMQDFEVVHDG